MVELRILRLRVLLPSLLLLSGACGSPYVKTSGVPSPDAKGAPPERSKKAALLCANLYYGFTCVAPPGFAVTEESTGPGPLLTLMRRRRAETAGAALLIRVHAMHRDRLKWVVEERVRSRLKRAGGVKRLGLKKASLGGRRGYEVRSLREAGGRTVYQRFFAFEADNNAFIVEYASTPEQARREPGLLDTFVSSIYFRTPP